MFYILYVIYVLYIIFNSCQFSTASPAAFRLDAVWRKFVTISYKGLNVCQVKLSKCSLQLGVLSEIKGTLAYCQEGADTRTVVLEREQRCFINWELAVLSREAQCSSFATFPSLDTHVFISYHSTPCFYRVPESEKSPQIHTEAAYPKKSQPWEAKSIISIHLFFFAVVETLGLEILERIYLKKLHPANPIWKLKELELALNYGLFYAMLRSSYLINTFKVWLHS